MKILHTADIHLGQIIYQNYDRKDEHKWFFQQMTKWCQEERPDALVVSGDIFDIQQPSATSKKMFTDYFATLHNTCPEMKIVITAGNHDSASRIHADSAVWAFAGTTLVGMPPADNGTAGWEDLYIVRMDSGYIVAVPFLASGQNAYLQHLLDIVKEENADGKPVVVMGHAAVTGLDCTGHDFEIGKIKTQDASVFGDGFDYLALGHIHKPQTIGHQEDTNAEEVRYPSPVVRYSGSALHVSCDEAFPHSVSVVEIDRHGGEVYIRQLRIDEYRHFYTLPDKGSFASSKEALEAIETFRKSHERGYIRLRMDYAAELPSNFNQMVYEKLAPGVNDAVEEYRYNPKIIWTGANPDDSTATAKPVFEVAELQQMNDPMVFVEKTLSQYTSFQGTDEEKKEMIRGAFAEVRKEMEKLAQERAANEKGKSARKTDKNTDTNNEQAPDEQ